MFFIIKFTQLQKKIGRKSPVTNWGLTIPRQLSVWLVFLLSRLALLGLYILNMVVVGVVTGFEESTEILSLRYCRGEDNHKIQYPLTCSVLTVVEARIKWMTS